MTKMPNLKNLEKPLLILGPAHAGKSRFVYDLLDPEREVVLLASALVGAGVSAERLKELESARPCGFEVIEAQKDLPAVVSEILSKAGSGQQIILDSINQWIAAEVVEQSTALDRMIDDLCGLIQNSKQDQELFLITSEVGACPPPLSPVESIFRQTLGRLNQRLAQTAASVVTVNAGIPHIIKSQS
jgi:adenosylcobinamide kinase/adenosylcobinamide-phosphate guanylyltransferase